jgi:hypothetical protein
VPDGKAGYSPGSGLDIDVSTITRKDLASTVVERERMVVAGDFTADVDSVARVKNNELSTVDEDVRTLLGVLILEVRKLRISFQVWSDTASFLDDDEE